MNGLQQNSSAAGRLTAAVIGAGCSFSLFAAYMVIPPAGILSGLLAPFPASFSLLRFGRGTAWIITLATAALLSVAFGIQAGLLYLGQCALIALLLPELLNRGLGAARSLLWTTAANVALYAVAALVFTVMSGQNLHLLVVKEINDSINQALQIYEKSGVTGEDLAVMKRSMLQAGDLIGKIYPALTTVMLLAVAGCNLALLRRMASRGGYAISIGDFREFRNPEPLVWLLIAAGFCVLIVSPLVKVPALNLLVILSVLYFLQGLAVISTIIARQAFAGMLRAVLYVTLLFQPYLAFIVAIIGIFDLWGDFRTPRNKENL